MSNSIKIGLDDIGIGASFICAIHCALLPLLLIVLPLTGLGFLHSKVLDFILLGTSFIIGCFALLRGYRKYHHKKNAILLFALGFPILVIGHFFFKNISGIVMIVIAASLIITAHWINSKAMRGNINCIH
jgi:hypothetical protein